MIALSGEEAGRALGSGPLGTPVIGVSTDTRSLQAGDLFVALRGERFDGHDYVAVALEAGACGAIVERATWEAKCARLLGRGRADERVYVVDDTLRALGALASEVRRKSGVLVLAVTGSAGKTSTKDILTGMVAQERRVIATAANQNNEVGVPLTLLRIQPETEAVVAEMGMRGRGQIAALAQVAEPDVGIITNIYPVHLELLGSLQHIAQAKAELLAGLRCGGVGVVPFGCDPLELCLDEQGAGGRRIVRFAVSGGLPCAAESADIVGYIEAGKSDGRQTLRIRWPDGCASLEVPAIPRHTFENLVAAAAGCYAAGLSLERCLPGFLDSGCAQGRGEVLEFPGLCIIDDTYNANPAAVRAALDNLLRLAERTGGRPVAVLGDMRELGPEEHTYHRQTGEYAAAAGVKLLWGVGPLSRSTAEGFGAVCAPDSRAGHVASPAESSAVISSLRQGDVVLFKASRGIRLEMMVAAISEEVRSGRWAPDTGEPSSRTRSRESGSGE
jgi:UDP-N-acetylmuramoyl-tripeptide--D-alanyl-D-alanine ligase